MVALCGDQRTQAPLAHLSQGDYPHPPLRQEQEGLRFRAYATDGSRRCGRVEHLRSPIGCRPPKPDRSPDPRKGRNAHVSKKSGPFGPALAATR